MSIGQRKGIFSCVESRGMSYYQCGGLVEIKISTGIKRKEIIHDYIIFVPIIQNIIILFINIIKVKINVEIMSVSHTCMYKSLNKKITSKHFI